MNSPNPQLSPGDFNLPHAAWRTHQYETVQWLLDQTGNLILQAPVGSGKTGIAAALASRQSLTALCRTKNLQADNYGSSYGFDVMFGKGNYPCLHPKRPDTCADTCPFIEVGMHECPVANRCPYLVAKQQAMASRKRSLNYAYYLSAGWPRALMTEALILDEAHELPDIVLEWAGLTLHEKTRCQWDLPEFPIILNTLHAILLHTTPPVTAALEWIAAALNRLSTQQEELTAVMRIAEDDLAAARQLRVAENLIRKLEATRTALQANPNDWFIQSSATGETPMLVCKPLSARYHFKNYFQAQTMVMMSATIGNHTAFANEIGLAPDQYHFRDVPNQWPPETRPVYDLQCPPLGHKANPQDYEQQAILIATAIRSCPPDWSGLIHVTRKSEATLLARRLAHHGLRRRVWTPTPGSSTNEQMQQWRTVKQSGPGKLAVVWAWWEGVDLREERICIAAKTPFPTLGDAYEVARLHYSGTAYLWRAAMRLEQALGRTRRGEPEDYDTNGRREQLVAIADSNWHRVQKYLSADLTSAIVKWSGS